MHPKGVLAMTEDTNSWKPTDPWETWEKWYGEVSQGWLKTINGTGSTSASPGMSDIYQTWLKSVTQAQELFRKSLESPQQLWNQWFEMTIAAWRKVITAGGDPLGLIAQWLDMLEDAQATVSKTPGSFSPDPFTLFKQWYDLTNETWSKTIGGVIGSDKFMEMSSEFLKNYAGFSEVLRRANEEYFHNLQLPTRADVARVAELVVNLENKVDQIDDRLESLEERRVSLATGESIASLDERVARLEDRLSRLESKLDMLLADREKSVADTLAQSPQTSARTRPKTRKSDSASRQSGEEEIYVES
jgi:polyhydroxyalkanoic acid synthase PhaR subunit